MALRGTLTHRKTRRLATRLGVDQCAALGYLEALWHVTAEQQVDGGIGRMSDQDIADEMFYSGDAAELIAALVFSKWLDEVPECRLYVHDWHEHADDSVKNKLARAGQRFANGTVPNMRRLSKEEREKYSRRYGEGEIEPIRAHGIRTRAHKSAPPVPVPEPVPVPVPEPEPGPESDEVSARAALELVRAAGPYIPPPPRIPGDFDGDVLFEELYSQHPRKGYRGMAQNLLAEAVAGGADPAEIKRVHRLCCPVWKRDRNPEIASGTLAQWLIDKGWRYPPEPDAAENTAARQGPASRLSVLDRLKPRSG